MLTRILVAVVLAPLFFVVLFFLDSIWLAALVAAICAMASFELLRATKVAHHNGMYFLPPWLPPPFRWAAGWDWVP